jgi:hypothetical protein
MHLEEKTLRPIRFARNRIGDATACFHPRGGRLGVTHPNDEVDDSGALRRVDAEIAADLPHELISDLAWRGTTERRLSALLMNQE